MHRHHTCAQLLVLCASTHWHCRFGWLQVITSRMRYISSQLEAGSSAAMRIVGLSTSLANAKDLGEWIGATSHGLFNFPPGVLNFPCCSQWKPFCRCPGLHLIKNSMIAACVELLGGMAAFRIESICLVWDGRCGWVTTNLSKRVEQQGTGKTWSGIGT